jgi:hypothetical protein
MKPGRYTTSSSCEARAFINQKESESRAEFRSMIARMLIVQVLLFGIGLPILLSAIRRLRHAARVRKQLYTRLEESNRQYIFDPGSNGAAVVSEQGTIERLLGNLRQASAFVKRIAGGDYDAGWEGLNEQNAALNRENLAGELIAMREQMKTRKQEDEIRIWTTEGLSEFASLIRKHQLDMEELADRLIAGLVQYLKIEQGGLFIVHEESDGHQISRPEGLFCLSAEKIHRKANRAGTGTGRSVLPRRRAHLYDRCPAGICEHHFGPGRCTPPGCILVVPMKTADGIEGVVELASLRVLQEYEIAFVERLGESVASALAAVRVNSRTRELLEQSQQQAEEMRAQEEEMRQNMEELQATQEQMSRKTEEVEQLLAVTSAEKEETLRMQLEAIDELQKEQETQARLAEEQARGLPLYAHGCPE